MRRGQCFSLRGQAPAGSSVLPQGLKELDPAGKHSYLLVRQRVLPGKLRVHRVKMRHKRLNLLLLEIALTRWFGLVCLIQSALKGRRHVGTTLACAVCAVLSRVMMCSDTGFDVVFRTWGFFPPPGRLPTGDSMAISSAPLPTGNESGEGLFFVLELTAVSSRTKALQDICSVSHQAGRVRTVCTNGGS
jgi:hypothetical protein